jgi:hypothetical protein
MAARRRPTWHERPVLVDIPPDNTVTEFQTREFDNLPSHVKGRALWDPRLGQGTGSYTILDTTLRDP